jgi:L-lactate dehydrogenase (cytochrome)
VGNRATIIMDSGIRSDTDVIRAIALGAHTSFAGKAFLWGLGALGEAGPEHVIDLLITEARSALGQIGAHSPAEARSVAIRHPGAFAFRKDEPG